MLQPPVSPSAGWLNVQMRYNCTGVRTEDWLKLQGFFLRLGLYDVTELLSLYGHRALPAAVQSFTLG